MSEPPTADVFEQLSATLGRLAALDGLDPQTEIVRLTSFVRTIEVPDYPLDVWPHPLAAYFRASAETVGAPVDMVATLATPIIGAVIGNRRPLLVKAGMVVRPALWTAVVAEHLDRQIRRARPCARSRQRPPSGRRRRLPAPAADERRRYGAGTAAALLHVKRDLRMVRTGRARLCRRRDGQRRTPRLAARLRQLPRRPRRRPPKLALALVRRRAQDRPQKRQHDLRRASGRRRDWRHPNRPLAGTGERRRRRRLSLALSAGDAGRESAALLRVDDRPRHARRRARYRLRLRQRDYHDPLPLSRDARDRFKRFCDENADAIDGGGVHDLFLAAYGKLPLQTAKLALVLQRVHDPDATTSEIPVDRVADAIDLVDYYAAHGVRAYALLGAAAPARPVGLARRILSAVNRAETPRVSRRDLHGLLGGHVASDDLSRALDDLCDRGRLVSERVSTGGRPAELYWLPDSLPCERTKLAEQSPGSGSSLLGERTKLDEQSAAGVRPANVVDFRDERSAIAAALEVLFAASGQIRTPEQRSYYDGLDLDGLAALVLDLPPDQRADWRRVIDGAPDRDEVALAARHATARAERQEGRAS